MDQILQQIEAIGIVPVIKIEDANFAVPLAKALKSGGIPVAEVTFRTKAAPAAIAEMVANVPNMIVGAGTVLTKEHVDQAIEAGAQFIVTPGFDPVIVKYCIEKNIPVTPGCTNPSEISQAINLGLEVVKFFPAEASGGLSMIKALAGPFGQIRFMPTGGIDENNLSDYLSFPKVLACGGSWMVPETLIKEGAFDQIASKTEEAVLKMLDFKLAHVGINYESSEGAQMDAELFSKMLSMNVISGQSSLFVGSAIELMRSPYKGAKGHIGIKTRFIKKALRFLQDKGYEFDMESAKYDNQNQLKAIYFKDEIGGFAMHLVQ